MPARQRKKPGTPKLTKLRAEAARSQRQAELDSQEEDLVAREAMLAATLHGKDEEVEKLAAVWTCELEHKHKEASMPKLWPTTTR